MLKWELILLGNSAQIDFKPERYYAKNKQTHKVNLLAHICPLLKGYKDFSVFLGLLKNWILGVEK